MIEPEEKEFDLKALGARVVQQREHLVQEKRQTLEWPPPADEPVVVRSDAGLIEQVLDNVICNAVKFTPLDGKIAVEMSTDAAMVCVIVADDGPGIPEAARSRLFTQFGRIGSTPTAGEDSHGQGLAIARGLAEALGGRLDLVAGGHRLRRACFEFRVPRNPSTSDGHQTVSNREMGQRNDIV
ncbi:MAG: HAMP domain-containing histidine kinase [Candidatus Synoicihabitans palmerolidicus]|nr:HAMP domain-containing histidine kinase [Candidatus Synoicihabitans palmerolidicus]